MTETGSDALAELRDRARALVDRGRLVELTKDLVGVASPTGGEAPLAEWIARSMAERGIEATTQPIGVGASNAWGWIGDHDGPSLLLYAPLDTVTAGGAEEDTPWAAAELRPDMVAEPFDEHGWVVGLGAHNPKGHAACVLMAVEALVDAGAADALDGRLLAGFGCLGMPANRRAPDLLDGHGAGCLALVEQLQPDAAVIAKSGWAVSHTEVGLVWFTVTVHGTHTYVGSRHLMAYRSAIGDAAAIINGLEDWFPVWAAETDDGFNTPQGVVASVDGGVARATAFTPASCSFTVDLRIAPATTPEQAEEAFTAKVRELAAGVGATVDVERTVSIPGTETDPTHPIITGAIEAWEAESGVAHEPIRGLSGATDANILRSAGVPTARVGLPKVSAPGVDVDFAYGMNAVNPDDQVRLTRQLIDTVCRWFAEPVEARS